MHQSGFTLRPLCFNYVLEWEGKWALQLAFPE